MKRKAISLLLCMTMAVTILPCFTVDASAATSGANTVREATVTEKEKGTSDSGGKIGGEPVLAYVPLDNRTVNVDRVIYEAESAGFQVIMPEEDLYATRLDGQPRNSNGTQFGDSQKLMEWIREKDKVTDYFVISLDQILSGGLVNSRTLCNTEYEDEYKVMDAIVDLSKNNHVYLIDTVARLASCTLDYQGATLEKYNYLREYNKYPRNVLGKNGLTIENIIDSYRRDKDGKMIPYDSLHSREIADSLHTRERKLKLIDYILAKDNTKQIKYFIGIDDSNSENTIQTNEVNYIRKKMDDRGLIFSGTDELGMMAVLSLMIDYYGYHVNAAAVYFGNTESSNAGSIYDMETVRENVEKHLKSIGVHLVEKSKADLEVVVLTTPAQSTMNAKYINRLIDYINNNISQGIPTIVINSAPSAYSSNLEYRMIRECEMSMLLSYSSWGTVGNSIGLALCNGISRYLYLHSRDNSSDKADIAFLKGLIFSYEKDISYLRGGGKELFQNYLNAKKWSVSNFYKNDDQVKTVNADLERLLKTSEYNVTVNDIVDNLKDCRYLKGLDGECGIIGNIDLSNYSAPFFRTFEIRFDIDVNLSDKTINGFKNEMTVNMPYNPENGQLTYAITLYYLDEAGKLHKVPSTYDKNTGVVKFTADSMSRYFTDAMSMETDKAYSLFSDVPKSAWYLNDVLFVHEKGLMRGTTDKTFEPKALMTRAMMVQTLYKMAGTPVAGLLQNMPQDVAGGSWYEPAVKWTLENKIASDDHGKFRPTDPVTREELANLLWRYASYKGMMAENGKYPGINNYVDVFSVSKEMRDGFDWACRTGIMNGTDQGTKLSPKAFATRAEVAAVLKRFAEK